MILYTLKKFVNEKLSAANGKFFAYPVNHPDLWS